MNKKRFLVYAVFVGFQSFLLQLIDQLIGTRLVPGGHSGFVFLAFGGWALYFLLGSSVRGAVTAGMGYICGIIFAVIMLVVPQLLPEIGIFRVPVTAIIVVPVMMYFEYAHWPISNVSIFFIGSGAFFGVYNYVRDITVLQAAGVVMLYCVLGLLSGFISIRFRSWYVDKVNIIEEKTEERRA